MAASRNSYKCLLFAVFFVALMHSRCHAEKTITSDKRPKQTDIKDVHIVFMNHLDVGYNGIPDTGFINNVLNTYFTQHFPRALNVSADLKNGGYTETFIYTTHPWLMYMYLYCPDNNTLNGIPLKCPTAEEKIAMVTAIKNGDVSYHAGPMNMQPENMNQLLFELSLNMSANLDQAFDIERQYRTLSQRDVPGMTIAVIPTLVKKNIKAVSVGVNDGTSPPAVPKIFTWKFDDDNSVIAMWHAGGYPDNPGPTPSDPQGLSRDDCVTFDGFDTALCLAFRTDNSGPPVNVQEILGYYEILRAEFPGATLHASTFEDFVKKVAPVQDMLPVVTNEIGDTWISGISSDPRKTAEYRVVMTVLTDCIRSGACDSTLDFRIQDAVNYLIKLGEHTWGLPGVYDTVNYTNKAFIMAKTGQNYQNCAQSWAEQRVYVQQTVDRLGDHPIRDEIMAALDLIQPPSRPSPSSLSGFVEVDPLATYTTTDGVEMAFGDSGGIVHLFDPFNKENWAKSMGDFGRFLYRTYDEGDFNRSNTMYPYKWGSFYQKPNLTMNSNAVSKFWDTKLDKLYKWKNTNDFVLLAKIVMSEAEPVIEFGAPAEVWIAYSYNTSKQGFQVILEWFDKTTTRIPESLMYFFSPNPPVSIQEKQKRDPVYTKEMEMENVYLRGKTASYSWKLRKLGQLVSPDNVVLNGSQYLHAVDSDVLYTTSNGDGLQVVAIDTPLVSLATTSIAPSPFPVPLRPISQQEITGFAFNMYNNMWDTNYILWYPYLEGDENFAARFEINFIKKK